MSETKCWECGTTENVRPIHNDEQQVTFLGCTSCYPPKAPELEDLVKRREAEEEYHRLAAKAGRIANAQDASRNPIERGQAAYEKLSLSKEDGTGCYMTGAEVRGIVDLMNLLIESRERTITRMERTVKACEASAVTIYDQTSLPMINAKQVISLLSLTWPDGNYSN